MGTRFGWIASRSTVPFARLLGAGAAACMAVLAAAPAEARDRPNIVLVLGDDHAWHTSGFMGHDVAETPHLDALSASGTTFTQGQATAPVCRPSILTIASGLHPRQWEAKRAALASEREVAWREEVAWVRTLPRELARAGYRSWQGGKWWDGSFAQAGFDRGDVSLRPGERQGDAQDGLGREGWDPERCGSTRSSSAPCPAFESVRAFLEEVDGRPFFLWFAPKLPHWPWDPGPEFHSRYVGRGLSVGEVAYYAQVTRLDAVVGELQRVLEEAGVAEDTLVVYLSDNGWELGQGLFSQVGHGKGSLHELGTRTPIVFSWPGRVPEGVVRDDLVSAEDLYPTLLDYAGLVAPGDRRGQSLRGAIETGVSFGREVMVSHFQGASDAARGHFVRTGDWRYVSAADGTEALFAVREDPFEEVDVAAMHPEVVAFARRAVVEWEAGIESPPTSLEVVGRVVDGEGRPVAHLPLVLESQGGAQRVSTSGLGWFRFAHVDAGTHTLRAGSGAPALAVSPTFTIPLGPTGRLLGSIDGSAPGPAHEASGEAGTTLHGRVFDRRGRAVAGAVVRVGRPLQRPSAWSVVRTGPEGRYVVEGLVPGRYRVCVLGPSGRCRDSDVVEVGGVRVEHDLALAGDARPRSCRGLGVLGSRRGDPMRVLAIRGDDCALTHPGQSPRLGGRRRLARSARGQKDRTRRIEIEREG